MENCVAEPEDPSLSAADSGAHRHRLPPVYCLFSQRVSTASWMLDCGHTVYMRRPVLVWVVCLFFWPRALPT